MADIVLSHLQFELQVPPKTRNIASWDNKWGSRERHPNLKRKNTRVQYTNVSLPAQHLLKMSSAIFLNYYLQSPLVAIDDLNQLAPFRKNRMRRLVIR